jgi:hypothetical protein
MLSMTVSTRYVFEKSCTSRSQLRSMEAIKDLTLRNLYSSFFGYEGQLVVLDTIRAPIHVGGKPVAVITWADIQGVLSRAGT